MNVYIPPPVNPKLPAIAHVLWVAGLFIFGLLLVTAGLALFQIIHAALEPGGLAGANFPL